MKTIKNLSAIATLILGIGATAQAQEVETLFGFIVGYEGITYQVYSGGCTTSDDFQVQQLETNPVQLKLLRNEPDLCEAHLPYGTTITVTWESLGLENGTEFVIANPIATRQRVNR